MSSKKTADLCVVTGTYTDSTGNTRNRYENIGSELTNSEGGIYFILKPYINLAGFAIGDKQGVLVNRFQVENNNRNNDKQAMTNERQCENSITEQTIDITPVNNQTEQIGIW